MSRVYNFSAGPAVLPEEVLKEAADDYKEPISKTESSDTTANTSEVEDDPEAEEVHAGTDVYKDYIGKRILHKAEGYGVVRTCDGKYLGIEFDEGPKAGKVTNYSLEACLSKGLIQIV